MKDRLGACETVTAAAVIGIPDTPHGNVVRRTRDIVDAGISCMKMMTLARKAGGTFSKCAARWAHVRTPFNLTPGHAMATRPVTKGDWTVAKLHALPDDGNKYEIIDGVLYVTPSPRFRHQLAIYELARRLHDYAVRFGFGMLCLAADIQYSDDTLVQPDLFVYPRLSGRKIVEWADVQPLQLVAEALSPSTRKRDRTEKRDLYLAQRVPEFWIVDLDTRTVERWTTLEAGVQKQREVLSWQPVPSHPPLTIDLVDYFRVVLDE